MFKNPYQNKVFLLNRYILSLYSMPSTLLDRKDTTANKKNMISVLYIQMQEAENKFNNNNKLKIKINDKS